MKKNKIIISFCIVILALSNVSNCFGVMQFESFLARGLTGNSTAHDAIQKLVNTYNKLGYQNALGGSKFMVNVDKGSVINYMNYLGNNFAMILSCHGDGRKLSMSSKNDPGQFIYPNEVSNGYWHLVFLNACSSLKDDSFPRALKTVGYSKRACLGWYNIVDVSATDEFFGHFYKTAGTTNLRQALLDAANKCVRSTPIRIYGDVNWNGYAF